jgi:hypothetical protein
VRHHQLDLPDADGGCLRYRVEKWSLSARILFQHTATAANLTLTFFHGKDVIRTGALRVWWSAVPARFSVLPVNGLSSG